MLINICLAEDFGKFTLYHQASQSHTHSNTHLAQSDCPITCVFVKNVNVMHLKEQIHHPKNKLNM